MFGPSLGRAVRYCAVAYSRRGGVEFRANLVIRPVIWCYPRTIRNLRNSPVNFSLKTQHPRNGSWVRCPIYRKFTVPTAVL